MSNKSKSKCGTVKNPCKYCLAPVTNRNGLQCQGACKKWAHYKCLHYTPGKISDIKAGIIKVMCPCPDCVTSQTKEYLTNPPFTCSNQRCPGNVTGPVKCDSADCPSNRKRAPEFSNCSTKTCAIDAADSDTRVSNKPYPARLPSPQCSPIPKTFKPSCERPAKPKRRRMVEVACSGSNSNSSCDSPPPCEISPPCEPEKNGAKDQDAMINALNEMSGTVGMLSNQIRELICKIDKIVEN